jgi:AcrR family transcriptional regulator
MGITERKVREKESMRASILDAALGLYLEKGIENVSIRNIATQIEYSPASIYLHYRDKDEIFYALYNLAFGEFLKQQQTLQTIQDPFDRLYQGCKQYINWGLANQKFYDLMFIIEIPMNVIAKEDCVDTGLQSFDVLRQTVRECIEQGSLRLKDVELASVMIWNMLHGIVSLIIKRRVLVPEEQVPGMLQAMLDNYFLLIKR